MGAGQLDEADGPDPARALALRRSRHLAFGRRRSAHTVRAYVATAHRLIHFLSRYRGEAVGRYGLMNLAAVDLRAFLADRRGEGLGPSSAAREMSAVRAFLRFAAEEEGNLPQLPRTRSPKRPRTLPRPASPADALALLVGDQGFRIDRHGVSRCEPALIARAAASISEVALRPVAHGHPLFGAVAGDVRAEALVALDGAAPYPRGLLLLGQSGAAADASDQGSQLLQFLGASLGAMLRRWARDN